MMRKVALVLAVSLVVVGSALAINPSLMAGGAGPAQQYNSTPRDDILWSEPPDVNGLIATSEVINSVGVISECANDFVIGADGLVCTVRWWGGYYNGNGCGDIGYGTRWNLRFYEDGGCVPTDVIYESLGAPSNETSIGCQAGLYPLYQYEASISAPVVGGNLYWFAPQCADHAFPPQVGRLAAMGVTNCEGAFKAAVFSFPDWTPDSIVFGVATDFSQEFSLLIGTPIQATTWGAVKGLYR